MTNAATTRHPNRSDHDDSQTTTMSNADTTIATSQARRTGQILAVLALMVGLWSVTATSQTGQVMPAPKFTAYDSNGDPCAGCLLFSYLAGTTTPAAVYAESALAVPHANPVVLDVAGRATIFVSPAISYKFTLKTAAGVDIWTVDSVVGPFSGVIAVTAANIRGLQISRTSAEAGLSIASTGGSGKTWGFASTTTGALQMRDDADGSPNITLGPGEAISLTTTGTISMPTSVLTVGGFGDHVFSASGNAPNRLGIRNTANGTAALSSLMLGNDAVVNSGALFALSTGYTTIGSYVADGVSLEATRAGGLSLNASHAAGDVRIYTGGSGTPKVTILDTGATSIGGAVDIAGGVALSSTAPSATWIETDAAVDNKRWDLVATGEEFYLRALNDAGSSGTSALIVTRTGNTVDSLALGGASTTNLGRYNSASQQPGFLAYNSNTDSAATGATVDFDAEVYDNAGNFAADTFTAPVTGQYHFCVTLSYSANAGTSYALRLVTTAYTFTLEILAATTAGVTPACTYVPMTAAQTASVQVFTGDAAIDIDGGAFPLVTTFSGRLVP